MDIVIAVALQAVIVWVFLTFMCVLIGYWEHAFPHTCVRANEADGAFGVGTMICFACIRTFIIMHGSLRNIIGFIMVCGAEATYIYAGYRAIAVGEVGMTYLAAANFTYLLTIPVLYGLQIRICPHFFIIESTWNVFVLLVLPTFLALQFRFKPLFIVLSAHTGCFFCLHFSLRGLLKAYVIRNIPREERPRFRRFMRHLNTLYDE